MNDLDDIARAAVAELKASVGHMAHTEEGLAALTSTAPTRRRPMILSLAAATVLLGGGVWYTARGTHDKSIGPATTAGQVDTSTTATPSTAATTTTVAALPDSVVLLRPDGIGAARFGMSFDEAMAILRSSFGDPLSDRPETVPVTAPELRDPNNADTYSTQWVFPAQRRVCWGEPLAEIGLCASFGGDRADALAMVGWDYSDNPVSGRLSLRLTDEHGLTLGTLWSQAAPYLSTPRHGCYFSADARTTTGIFVDLAGPLGSNGPNFGSCSDPGPVSGTNLPSPDTVSITGLRAGQVTGSPPGD